MFGADANVSGVAHAIQLALTPVFLLTGIAGILNVMTGRLARVIDRGRYLTDRAATPDGRLPEDTEALAGVLFTGATLALVVGLTFFLAEVRLATRSVRIRGSGSRP